nr:molybdopterin-guanine dinucleotide biosynthesis protein B [Hartmannibacter diazotrophicus]
MPVIGVAGWKNSGKTTLVVRLVSELVSRGFRVSTVKHAHHKFDIDHEGTDSWRHREAGAKEVCLVSTRRVASQLELRGDPEPPLGDILAGLAPTDIIIAEGFKESPIPKIEIRRLEAKSHDPLVDAVPNVVAIVADHPVVDLKGLPGFSIDAISDIADFVAQMTAGKTRP